MTEPETQAWLAMLGRNKPEQIECLQDLLDNSVWDSMSEEDKQICLQSFTRLTGSEWACRHLPRYTRRIDSNLVSCKNCNTSFAKSDGRFTRDDTRADSTDSAPL